MIDTTEKKDKESDSDKSTARPDLKSQKKEGHETETHISSESIMAEKDEIKIAEEKLRQKNKSK